MTIPAAGDARYTAADARSTVGKSSFVWFINEHRDSLLFIVQDSEKKRYMFMLVPATQGADPNSWEDTKKIILRNIGFDTPLNNLGGGAAIGCWKPMGLNDPKSFGGSCRSARKTPPTSLIRISSGAVPESP